MRGQVLDCAGRGLLFYRQAPASRARFVAFAVLLLWALRDAVLTFRDWGPLPLWTRLCEFLGSLFLGLLLMGLIALAWDWLARRCCRA